MMQRTQQQFFGGALGVWERWDFVWRRALESTLAGGWRLAEARSRAWREGLGGANDIDAQMRTFAFLVNSIGWLSES